MVAPAALALAALALGAAPAAAACRLALALGFDVSRSVSAADYAIQAEGILAALDDPAIRRALLDPPEHVALAVYEWSGQAHQEIVADWTELRDAAALEALRARLAAHERSTAARPTALGAALDFGHGLLARAPDCAAHTLDLSGDGRNNDGPRPEHIHEARDFAGITVNALAIGGHEADIAAYFAAALIRGPGAFVEWAQSHADFPAAFRRKLERELTAPVFGAAPARAGPG